jgi:hypothetical protein
MTFGQILDRIFRLLRSNYQPFMGIGVPPVGVPIAFYAVFFGVLYLAGVFQHPPAQPNMKSMLWIVFPMGLLFLPVMFLVYGLYYGASNYAALKADHGFKVTAGEAFRHAWSKAGRYVGLMVLRSLIIAIPIVVCAFTAFAAALLLGLMQSGHPNAAALFFLIPLGILLYLGTFVYAVILSLRLSLAFPASVSEDLTAVQSIKRSGVLTEGAKGRIFLVLLVIYAIGYAAAMIVYAVGLFIFAIGAVAGMGHLHTASPLTISLVALAAIVVIAVVLLGGMLLMAAYSIAFAVFYRDQCLRKDGQPPSPAHAAALA